MAKPNHAYKMRKSFAFVESLKVAEVREALGTLGLTDEDVALGRHLSKRPSSSTQRPSRPYGAPTRTGGSATGVGAGPAGHSESAVPQHVSTVLEGAVGVIHRGAGAMQIARTVLDR